MEILEAHPDQRISVADLFEELKKPPFGVRDGLMPLLIAILIICRRNQIALYYEGTFANEIDTHLFQVLAKKPTVFELQSCKIDGLRIDLLEQIHGVLRKAQVSLHNFLMSFSHFAKQSQVSQNMLEKQITFHPLLRMLEIQFLMHRIQEILFKDLPEALGLAPFDSETTKKLSRKSILEFSAKLEGALDELRHALNALRARLQLSVLRAFEKKQNLEEFQDTRSFLTTQSEEIAITTSNMDLKAFCMRMMDRSKSDSEWIDSVAEFSRKFAP